MAHPSRLPSLVRFELVAAVALLTVAHGGSAPEVAELVVEDDERRAALARPFLLVIAAAVPRRDEPGTDYVLLGQTCLDALAVVWQEAHRDADEWELLDVLFTAYRATLRELGDLAGLPLPQAHRIVRALGEASRHAVAV